MKTYLVNTGLGQRVEIKAPDTYKGQKVRATHLKTRHGKKSGEKVVTVAAVVGYGLNIKIIKTKEYTFKLKTKWRG